MYYSNGNYEAFARPQKPENAENKSAYIVGSGLAGLAAAAFLIRDGQVPGNNIHIFEELELPGGSMDGILNEQRGYIIRGGREMEPHFETLWDLFRSIPTLDDPETSVLDEFYWLNKKDPSYSTTRAIENRGEQITTDGQLTLSRKAITEIAKLVLTSEKQLGDVKINEVFGSEFFKSNFWLYWSTMFAFEPWASAIEMRRYLLRFVHHVGTLQNMSALKFTKFNQYESLVKPLIKFLKNKNVDFQYNTTVDNIIVSHSNGKKTATELVLTVDGEKESISLSPDDLVFVTNGSITESTTYGDNTHPAPQEHKAGASWDLWEKLADQDTEFGRPSKFYKNIPKANWVISATCTFTDDRVIPYIKKITGKDPHSGSIVTSGPVSIKDSNWLLGISISRQPHFQQQKSNELIVWLYGLFSDQSGNYVHKKITDCSGEEICKEFLYHIGVPEEQIDSIAKSANSVPVNMPYITSYFMPRTEGDRPLVVPTGSQNLAFIGNFAETSRDTVFTTEYSVRTAMEAVYQLLDVDRGIPEVFASSFDLRTILDSVYYLNDQKSLQELPLNKIEKVGLDAFLKKIQGTYLEEILKEEKLI
ncbi:oleate hydratase [Liquorilactobacillus hordei]|uniref:Oleate hydratase n=1 Tax=Liquorilactobacillus hordei TaxID=468911 RepID=A0A3Q8CY23_9LACO|nr:oleate hydratase [Liquorilactobacillus hordei]AUJ29104.1 oleate hydratase [Liquorilactobacillus hordei]